MGFQIDPSQKKGDSLIKNDNYLKRPVEAAMALSDRVNQGYLRTLFNDTQVIAGQQLMPYRPNARKEAEKVANVLGNLVFPCLLAINMPAFLY
jgi:hypothetical protein